MSETVQKPKLTAAQLAKMPFREAIRHLEVSSDGEIHRHVVELASNGRDQTASLIAFLGDAFIASREALPALTADVPG